MQRAVGLLARVDLGSTEVLHDGRNAGVVGGDVDGVQAAAPRLLIDPLDHGLATNVNQWFAWETGRGVAGGNDADGGHNNLLDFCPNLKEN